MSGVHVQAGKTHTMSVPSSLTPEHAREQRAPSELPSRAALIARLETQRTELLRAMSCVSLERRTIEQHVAKPPFGPASPLGARPHEIYRQRVLEALRDAGEALGTAYPMLERIAHALDVEQILKGHVPERESLPAAPHTEDAGSARPTQTHAR